MTEHGLLMKGWLVRQTLAGLKTETRRLRGLGQFNENPDAWKVLRPMREVEPCLDGTTQTFPGRTDVSWLALKDPAGIADMGYQPFSCPYGVVGDRLWVRETFRRTKAGEFIYAATDPKHMIFGPWKPSIHMPRAACRLVLEITALRCERLQEISDADVRTEGMPEVPSVGKFRVTWDEINPEMDWDRNPWVWVITFRMVADR